MNCFFSFSFFLTDMQMKRGIAQFSLNCGEFWRARFPLHADDFGVQAALDKLRALHRQGLTRELYNEFRFLTDEMLYLLRKKHVGFSNGTLSLNC